MSQKMFAKARIILQCCLGLTVLAATSVVVLSPSGLAGASTVVTTLAGTNTTSGSTTTVTQNDALSFVGGINPASTDGSGYLQSVSAVHTLGGPATITS